MEAEKEAERVAEEQAQEREEQQAQSMNLIKIAGAGAVLCVFWMLIMWLKAKSGNSQPSRSHILDFIFPPDI